MPEPASQQSRAAPRRLLLFAFVDELGPFLAIYTLLFADHGITTAQTSWVFALWALLGVVFEVPSGALSDRVDRRRLLAGAILLRALGISVWLVWPTFAGVVVGAALWAVHTATASGTYEALVYEQLLSTGEVDRYPVLMARLGQANHLGTALGALMATGMVSGLSWTLPTLGWSTVVLHLPALWAVLSLPASGDVEVDDGVDGDGGEDGDDEELNGWGGWWRTLRAGVGAVRGRPGLRRWVLLCAVLEGIFVVDEYVPLLARQRGVDDGLVPLFVMCVWGGLLIGGELAARRPQLSAVALAALMALALATMGAGLSVEHSWALVLLGVAYGAMNTTWILSEARLQAAAPSTARATTRSVVSLFSALLSMVLFVVVQQLNIDDDPTPGLLFVVVGLAMVGLGVLRTSTPQGDVDAIDADPDDA